MRSKTSLTLTSTSLCAWYNLPPTLSRTSLSVGLLKNLPRSTRACRSLPWQSMPSGVMGRGMKDDGDGVLEEDVVQGLEENSIWASMGDPTSDPAADTFSRWRSTSSSRASGRSGGPPAIRVGFLKCGTSVVLFKR